MATRRVSRSKELQITFEGPFFTADPRKTFRRNIRDMVAAIAKESESSVRRDIEGRRGQMPYSTGHTARSVVGRTKSVSGKPWQVSAVISANTQGMNAKGAKRTLAAAASVERRWHPFRRHASAIRRSRAVLSANLTKGLE